MTEETILLERLAFGRHIGRLREDRGMSRAQLAKLAQLSTETIAEIETGEVPISLTMLRQLAGSLDLMLSSIFESFERQDERELRQLVALLRGRGSRIIGAVITITRTLVETVDDIPPAANDGGGMEREGGEHGQVQ